MEENKEGLLSFKLNEQTGKIEYIVIKTDPNEPKPKKKKKGKKKSAVPLKTIESGEQLRQEGEIVELSVELLEADPTVLKIQPKKEEASQLPEVKIDKKAAILFQSVQGQKLDSLLNTLILETNQQNVLTNKTMDQISQLVSPLSIETLMILCYPQKLNYLHKLTDFDPTMTPFVSSENKYIEDLLIKEQAKHFSDLWKKFCPGEPLPAYDFSYH